MRKNREATGTPALQPRHRLLAVSLLLITGGSTQFILACGDAPAATEGTAATQQDIRNGTLVTPWVPGTSPEESKAVLFMQMAGGSHCSATLVHREWALTSAHCQYWIGATATSRRPTGDVTRVIDEYWLHRSTDAALVHFSEPFTDIEPVPLVTSSPWYLSGLRCYGYGFMSASGSCLIDSECSSGQSCEHIQKDDTGNITGTGWCMTPSDGLRYGDGLAVTSVDGYLLAYEASESGQVLLGGDSGGPCLFAGMLIGVNKSTSWDLKVSYGVNAFGIRDWMGEAMRWVQATNTLPTNAVPTGQISDSGTCYACTANVRNGAVLNEHAGKLCRYNDRLSCFISNGGAEQRHETYRVLTGYAPGFTWSPMSSAEQPPQDAVHAGWIQDSGTCYACRASAGGNQHAGKLCNYDGRWSCFIGNGGVSQRYENYEVMRDRARAWRQIRTISADNRPIGPSPSPIGAVKAGWISNAESSNCYACSVALAGGSVQHNTHIGKMCKYDGRWSCFIGNGGSEKRYDHYMALVGKPMQYAWSTMTSQSAPPANAVWGGWVEDSGDCYVCRTSIGSDKHVGKLCSYGGRWSCFIGNGGTEQRHEQYEVMIRP